MDAKTMEIAEVVYDYIKNGDQDTSREECIKWIKSLLAEATASMFTEEDIEKAYDAGNYSMMLVYDQGIYAPHITAKQWLEQYRKEKHGARSQSGNVEA